MKPYIPKPCHEDWNSMSEKDKGRHCEVCAKVVVDFTKMSDAEMIDYLQQHQHQKTCGHFRTEQLLQTEEIVIDIAAIPKNTPFKSLFFACLLIVFSSLFLISCTSCMMGKVKLKEEDKDSTQATHKIKKDSLQMLTGAVASPPKEFIEGEIAPLKNKTECKKQKTKTANNTIKGDIEMIPVKEDTIQQKTMGKPTLPKQK